jgi:uncharacterized membrane protein
MILAFAVLAVLVMLVILMNASAPKPYTVYELKTVTFEKGVVTAILDEDIELADGLPGRMTGSQKITVHLRSGAQKGREITLDNYLSYEHSVQVGVGQRIVVAVDVPEDGEPYYMLYNYDRTPRLLLVAAILIVLMASVGGFKGVRSVLGLGISLFVVLAFLVPAIYRGLSPVWTSVLTAVVVSVFSLLMLNGFSQKTLTAAVATVAGILASVVCFFVISAILKFSGYDIYEAQDLFPIAWEGGLKLSEVLFAGVLISSLGAVMDTTVSVAASLYEMKDLQPDMNAQSLFQSGMTVGRDIIGAMCQTLILAFVGSSMATLFILISHGTQFDQFLSSNYLAAEVVHGITGSLAVILAVPITAGSCVLFGGYVRRGDPSNANKA